MSMTIKKLERYIRNVPDWNEGEREVAETVLSIIEGYRLLVRIAEDARESATAPMFLRAKAGEVLATLKCKEE